MSALTKYFDKLRGVAPEVEPVLAVLEVMQAVTGVGGPGAAAALKILDSALRSLEAAASGVLTHEDVVAQLRQMGAEVTADRAREDAELAAMGPPTSTGGA